MGLGLRSRGAAPQQVDIVRSIDDIILLLSRKCCIVASGETGVDLSCELGDVAPSRWIVVIKCRLLENNGF